MKLLTNPTVLQMFAMLIVIGAISVFGVIAVRAMRNGLQSDVKSVSASPRADSHQFALATYQGVITNLKQKEQQLVALVSSEKGRAAAAEASAQLIIENINTGVIVFSANLLVQQANPAARRLLGFASPLNMHVKEVFRGLQTVELPSSNGALTGISQAIRNVISSHVEYRDIPATYSTPAGESRALSLILLPVHDSGTHVTSALCLIGLTDQRFSSPLPGVGTGTTAAGAD